MVSDAEAGPPGLAPPSKHCMKCSPTSSELGQQDFILGNPAAQSTAQKTLQKQALHKHVKQAKDHAQAAYEQSCTALELILMSMEKVCTAFAEAKCAWDRYHNLLVSSRSRKNIRHHCANAHSPSTYMAG